MGLKLPLSQAIKTTGTVTQVTASITECAHFRCCLSGMCRYSSAEKKTAMVKVEEMLKLQKKAQDQMKKLVRVIIELVQCVRYKRSELNFSFNCLKVFSQFHLGGVFFSSALFTI